ncbi:MAG: ATP-dependent protease ATPase subunit HslU [Hyphomonadaceae bacterium]
MKWPTDAKRAVAQALRNCWRRKQLLSDAVARGSDAQEYPDDRTHRRGQDRDLPPPGEVSWRCRSSVEATKFTEVGYVGRDVEQIVRDLVEVAIAMVRDRRRKEVLSKAEANAEERVLNALVGASAQAATRESFRTKLRAGQLDDKEIEIDVTDTASPLGGIDIPGQPGASIGMVNLGDLLKGFGGRQKRIRTTVKEAHKPLIEEESDKLLDNESVTREALRVTEEDGIVFLDEIDKIASRSERAGADVSREGVQRDLLPLIEGTTVTTKHGPVKTDHVLFIASGAFHVAKPSDLLPELQGRLPIRVELKALSREDFKRILTEPEANLILQYSALMKTEGVELVFEPEAVDAIADIAVQVNDSVENIGARRLHTVLERVLDEISFTASDRNGETFTVTGEYVRRTVGPMAGDKDLSKYIL